MVNSPSGRKDTPSVICSSGLFKRASSVGTVPCPPHPSSSITVSMSITGENLPPQFCVESTLSVATPRGRTRSLRHGGQPSKPCRPFAENPRPPERRCFRDGVRTMAPQGVYLLKDPPERFLERCLCCVRFQCKHLTPSSESTILCGN